MSWNRVREGGPRRLGRTLLPLPSQLPILGTEPSTGNNHVPPSDKVGQPLFQIQWGITACTERRRKDGQQPTQEQVLAHDGSRSLQGGRSFMVSNGDSGREIVTLGKSDRATAAGKQPGGDQWLNQQRSRFQSQSLYQPSHSCCRAAPIPLRANPPAGIKWEPYGIIRGFLCIHKCPRSSELLPQTPFFPHGSHILVHSLPLLLQRPAPPQTVSTLPPSTRNSPRYGSWHRTSLHIHTACLLNLLNSRGFKLQTLLQTFPLSIPIEWTSFTIQSQLLCLQHLQGPQQCGRHLAHSFECVNLFSPLTEITLKRTPMGLSLPNKDYHIWLVLMWT